MNNVSDLLIKECLKNIEPIIDKKLAEVKKTILDSAEIAILEAINNSKQTIDDNVLEKGFKHELNKILNEVAFVCIRRGEYVIIEPNVMNCALKKLNITKKELIMILNSVNAAVKTNDGKFIKVFKYGNSTKRGYFFRKTYFFENNILYDGREKDIEFMTPYKGKFYWMKSLEEISEYQLDHEKEV